jgi:hypothetical protein
MANMAVVAQDLFQTLAPEVRLVIWQFLYTELYYFASGFHLGCDPDAKGLYHTGPGFGKKSCLCWERQVNPLLVCKMFYTELKPLVSTRRALYAPAQSSDKSSLTKLRL